MSEESNEPKHMDMDKKSKCTGRVALSVVYFDATTYRCGKCGLISVKRGSG